MINSRMTPREILGEYWKDYHDFLKPRCFKVVERKSKDLIKLQRSMFGKNNPPDSWWHTEGNTRSYNSPRGNKYSVILGMKLLRKFEVSAIKTNVYLEFLDSTRGSKTVIFFPANENTNNIVVISAKFMKELREQEGIEMDKFIREIAGNFTVYSFLESNPGDDINLEIDFHDFAIGLGKVRKVENYIEYKFLHYLGEEKVNKMQEKVGSDILDPIKLWNAYYTPNTPKIDPAEYKEWEEVEREEKMKILDEIFEKYENY